MPVLDVYSRQGCHLCEVLIESLLEHLADRATINVHDIDIDPTLRQKYDARVPVVVFQGTEVCEFRLDAEAVDRALAEQT